MARPIVGSDAPYALLEIEITEKLVPLVLGPRGEHGAHVLVRHRGRPVGRLWLEKAEHGETIAADRLDSLVWGVAGKQAAILATGDVLLKREGAGIPSPTPNLTITVCTRNRAALLRRCLASLVALSDGHRCFGQQIDVLVVDNAPPDDKTREAAQSFPGVRHVVEPVPGLNFARNRALASTDRPWLAFIDDDAVADRHWLDCLANGIAASPDAGGFTGLVLPLFLDTEAQLCFERDGGFGSSFATERVGTERWGDRLHPANAARLGTGACMVFSTDVLRAVGGFDEALDTGPPLPTGGDIDMFYQVLRAGYRLVYLPGLLAHHEHRRDMAGLRAQYFTWGQGLAVVARKNAEAEPEMSRRLHGMLRRWFGNTVQRLLLCIAGRDIHRSANLFAELRGGVVGYFGEYERSQTRIAIRKREHGT